MKNDERTEDKRRRTEDGESPFVFLLSSVLEMNVALRAQQHDRHCRHNPY